MKYDVSYFVPIKLKPSRHGILPLEEVSSVEVHTSANPFETTEIDEIIICGHLVASQDIPHPLSPTTQECFQNTRVSYTSGFQWISSDLWDVQTKDTDNVQQCTELVHLNREVQGPWTPAARENEQMSHDLMILYHTQQITNMFGNVENISSVFSFGLSQTLNGFTRVAGSTFGSDLHTKTTHPSSHMYSAIFCRAPLVQRNVSATPTGNSRSQHGFHPVPRGVSHFPVTCISDPFWC